MTFWKNSFCHSFLNEIIHGTCQKHATLIKQGIGHGCFSETSEISRTGYSVGRMFLLTLKKNQENKGMTFFSFRCLGVSLKTKQYRYKVCSINAGGFGYHFLYLYIGAMVTVFSLHEQEKVNKIMLSNCFSIFSRKLAQH